MEFWVGVILLICVLVLPNYVTNKKLDNYDMSKVDTGKLCGDAAKGVSVAERRRRCVNGYYDKK